MEVPLLTTIRIHEPEPGFKTEELPAAAALAAAAASTSSIETPRSAFIIFCRFLLSAFNFFTQALCVLSASFSALREDESRSLYAASIDCKSPGINIKTMQRYRNGRNADIAHITTHKTKK